MLILFILAFNSGFNICFFIFILSFKLYFTLFSSIFSFFLFLLKNIFASTGITAIAVTRLKPTAALTAMAISPKSCPASSFINTTGKNTAIVVKVEASTAPHTSFVA